MFIEAQITPYLDTVSGVYVLVILVSSDRLDDNLETWIWFACSLYVLLCWQGHIDGGDGDGMIDRNPAPTHLPKQWLFYIPQHIDML